MGQTVLLVHGAWHGAWAWDRVLARLRSAGVEALAVDLPGHGGDPVAFGDLHGDAARVRQELDRMGRDVVLVGHSYGGGVALSAAVCGAPRVSASAATAGPIGSVTCVSPVAASGHYPPTTGENLRSAQLTITKHDLSYQVVMDGPIPTSTLLAAPDWDETYEVDVLLAKANGYGIADIVTNYNSVNDRPAARPRTGWTTGFFGHHEPSYTEAQRLRPALMIKGDTLDVSIPRAELPSLSTPLRWGIETGNSFLSPDGNEFDATYDCPTSFTWGGTGTNLTVKDGGILP